MCGQPFCALAEQLLVARQQQQTLAAAAPIRAALIVGVCFVDIGRLGSMFTLAGDGGAVVAEHLVATAPLHPGQEVDVGRVVHLRAERLLVVRLGQLGVRLLVRAALRH